jgi:hypothetical protein
MNERGIGDNRAPFDCLGFIDFILESPGSAYEKLIAIAIARHIGKDGKPAYPSRNTILRLASCSLPTFKRAQPVVNEFYFATQRDGRSTEYVAKTMVTTSEIEVAISNLRANTGYQRDTGSERTRHQRDTDRGIREIPAQREPGFSEIPGGAHCDTGGGIREIPQKETSKEPLKEDMSSVELPLEPDDPSPKLPRIVSEAFELYNLTAEKCGLPVARVLSPSRADALRSRVKEAGGLDGFKEALANIERSAFLQGNNDRGWKADLKFVCQASSFARLLEGGYGNGVHASPSSRPQTVFRDSDIPDVMPRPREVDA